MVGRYTSLSESEETCEPRGMMVKAIHVRPTPSVARMSNFAPDCEPASARLAGSNDWWLTHLISPSLDGVYRPAMGVVKRLDRVAARFSLLRTGWEVLPGFLFGGVLPRVCGQVLAFDRPTCYPCPALPGAAHIMLLYEHGRGKRAHPIYQRVLAQGRSRARAAYQSCLF